MCVFSYDVYIDLITLMLHLDLDVLDTYIYTENEVSGKAFKSYDGQTDRQTRRRKRTHIHALFGDGTSDKITVVFVQYIGLS